MRWGRAGGRVGARRGRGTAWLVVVLAVLGLAGCWRQPGYDALRQGWNPVEDRLTAANAATLTEAWTAPVDDGPVRSDPVVSGTGYVHVSDDLAAYALDARSGERGWRTEVVPSVPGYSPPPVTDGVTSDEADVHVAWGGRPNQGQLEGAQVRLDAATGAVRDSRAGIGPRVPTLAGPWRVGPFEGVVETTVGIAGLTVDGPARWTLLTDYRVNQRPPVPTAPAVLDDRFFVGLGSFFERTNLLAGWDLAGPPTGSCPSLRCEPDIEVALDGVPTAPAVAADKATVYTATDAGTVYAVDTATGAIRWTAAVGSPVSQPLAWTPDALYAVTGDGDLVTLDPGGCGAPTCTPASSTPLAGAPVAAPAVAGGVVYVASEGGVVEAFATADLGGHGGHGPGGHGHGGHPSPIWSATVDGGTEVTGGPTVANGLLLVGTAGGHVVAFAPAA